MFKIKKRKKKKPIIDKTYLEVFKRIDKFLYIMFIPYLCFGFIFDFSWTYSIVAIVLVVTISLFIYYLKFSFQKKKIIKTECEYIKNINYEELMNLTKFYYTFLNYEIKEINQKNQLLIAKNSNNYIVKILIKNGEITRKDVINQNKTKRKNIKKIGIITNNLFSKEAIKEIKNLKMFSLDKTNLTKFYLEQEHEKELKKDDKKLRREF